MAPRAHVKKPAKKPGKRPASAASRRSPKAATGRRWSGEVNAHSNALDLAPAVFKSGSARSIAQSLKRSAQASRRRQASPFQSAMSMLNFYINRGGSNLPASHRQVLERAKAELRRAFGRE